MIATKKIVTITEKKLRRARLTEPEEAVILNHLEIPLSDGQQSIVNNLLSWDRIWLLGIAIQKLAGVGVSLSSIPET